MNTWRDWLDRNDSNIDDGCDDLHGIIIAKLGDAWWDTPFAPTAQDRECAWGFLLELRSRITTQALPYLDGDEAAALSSVHKLFELAREACHAKGVAAARFSELVWAVMDGFVRPMTTKWHRTIERGALSADTAHQLREDLLPVQRQLRFASRLLESLAKGEPIQRVPVGLSIPPGPQDQADQLEFSEILFSPEVKGAREIYEAELEEIRKRRMAEPTEPPRPTAEDGTAKNRVYDLTGLALSGGGLRSATFALGALQALAKNRVLANFDYLSTVSGGGYAGSFLSCFLNSADGNLRSQTGLNADQLPFQRQASCESAAMRHLRSASRSLLAGGFARRLEIPVLALAGWMASVFVALPPIVFGASLIAAANSRAIRHAVVGGKPIYGRWGWPDSFRDISVPLIVAVLMLCLFIALFWTLIRQHFLRKDQQSHDVELPTATLRCTGLLMLITVGAMGVLIFPYSLRALDLHRSVGQLSSILAIDSFTAVASVIAVPIFTHLASRWRGSKRFQMILSAIGTTLLPALFLWAITALLCRYWFFSSDDPQLTWIRLCATAVGAVGVFLLTLPLFNVNACSLHPFYRDRLARAYHLQPAAHERVVSRVRQKLSELRTYNQAGPYHLINASLNAKASGNEKLRGRVADFFTFGSRYCGSESTGYEKTTEFESHDPGLDLSTATAISGAAASPMMGVRRSRFSFWAALLNIRLDYWLRIPGRGSRSITRPGPIYWLRHYVGLLKSSTTFVNLSDGGHIDNTGLYELLRRRCRYIVVVDGECDPGITCDSLLQALRYAKIDFGIEVEIDLSRLRHAEKLAPTVDGEGTSPASPLVDYHYALGRIDYPCCQPGDARPPAGLLLFLKSSLSGNEDKSIQNYRDRQPDFPHQSTADLAYDEEQFECYRSLGEHIVDDTFRKELVGNSPPTNVRDWLAQLKHHLHR